MACFEIIKIFLPYVKPNALNFSEIASMLELFISQIVGEVDVQGLRYRQKEAIVDALHLRKGLPYPKLLFRAYIYNLYKQGYLDSLFVFGEISGDTLNVKVLATDAPVISKFRWNIKKVDEKNLNDSISIYIGLPATKYRLKEIERYIEGFYERRNYINTDVSLRLENITPSRVAVIVEGNLGEKYKLAKIYIEGNRYFSDATLKSLMKNKELNWIRRILRSGWFSAEKLKEDISAIENFYHNHGFPDARVDTFFVRYDVDRKLAYIHIRIHEGKKYYFGNITFSGNVKFSDEELRKHLAIGKPPNIFQRIKYRFFLKAPLETKAYSKEKLMLSIQNIAGLYADSGYLYVQVEPSETRRDSFIDVDFRIKENWKVRIRLVNILNNTKTWEEVIRRELYVFPGEYFNRSKLMLSYRNLYYLNYFSNIGINFKPVREDSSYVDLEISVEEKPTGQIGGGASYSQLDGFYLNASLRQPNFMGRGWNFSIVVEYGARRKNFQIGFTDPWFGGEPITLGGSIYNTTIDYFTFTQRNTGFSVTYGRRLWNIFSRITLSYALDRIEVLDLASFGGTPFYEFWSKRKGIITSGLTVTFAYDNRDRIFNASRGFRFSFPWKIVGGPLGGDLFYTRITPEFQLFVPNYKDKLVSFVRLNWGSLFPLLHAQQLPPFEYFALGDVGYYGLRGYDLRSIGTRVGNAVLGGRHFFRFTFEERIRFSDQFFLLFFYEAGNSWWSLKTIDYKLFSSVGVGFRIEVPMLGVMGFDFAYSLENREFKTHFQIGPY